MIDNLDIYRAANLLVERHGPDVAIGAACRADELLVGGNTEGYAVWKRILAAVAEITRTTPAKGERIN
jgi:hypothetical protein